LLAPRPEAAERGWRRELAAGETLATLVVRRLLSKRFRKSPLDTAVAERVHRAVASSLREQRPLRLLVPFGGYKSTRSPEHPRAGWAELFSALGTCELVAPIAAFHPPGVVVDYSSDEWIVPRLTGLRKPALEEYRRGFDRVLGFVGAREPANVALRQTFSRDAYDVERVAEEVEALGRSLEASWLADLPPDERRRLLARAARNRVEASPETNAVQRAACQHQAYLVLDERWRTADFHEPCTIPVALRRGIPGWLHLGSNRRSDTQFWIGWGLVDTTGRRPVDRILSPRHAALLEGALHEVRTNAVDLPGFERLPVYAVLQPFEAGGRPRTLLETRR
jgi:hypothetical protein